MKPTSLLVLLMVHCCSVTYGATRETAPTLFIAGDSTAARVPGPGQQGWAEPVARYFDPSSVRVENRAIGGRSSRTFISAGDWDALLAELEAGDVVLIQFGHNDAGALNQEPPGSTRPLRARGTIPGTGEEVEEIDNVLTGKHEIVHTYGWYLRKMIADVRSREATPILLTLTVRNVWADGRIECGRGSYRDWAQEVAKQANVLLVDVRRIIADSYQKLGSDPVARFFDKDDIHTNDAGADFSARAVVSGLRTVREPPFEEWLSAAGRSIPPDSGPGEDSVCEIWTEEK